MLVVYVWHFNVLESEIQLQSTPDKAWFSYAADAPATWPPVQPGILFRYDNRSSRQHCSSQSLHQACLRSWLKFNFAGMPAVELCDDSSCRRRMFSFVREVAQVVPAATSQIHNRHMKTRLNSNLQGKSKKDRVIRSLSYREFVANNRK